jgi:hypothetical protein
MGDDSFAAFYTASYQRLLGQLFAVTGDLAEAENLLQEAYARAYARWAQVRAYDRPEAWGGGGGGGRGAAGPPPRRGPGCGAGPRRCCAWARPPPSPS